jgi:hypothetical protein
MPQVDENFGPGTSFCIPYNLSMRFKKTAAAISSVVRFCEKKIMDEKIFVRAIHKVRRQVVKVDTNNQSF